MVIDLLFILFSLTIVLAAVAAISVWHIHQVRRLTKEMLLCRAVELEEEATSESGDAARRTACFQELVECLFQYVELAPNDADARVRLAKAFDRSHPARPVRVIALYYDALGVAADWEIAGLRCRLAELLLDAGGPLVDIEEQVPRCIPYEAWFVRAEEEADELLKGPCDETLAKQAIRFKALALYGQWLTNELVGQRTSPSVVGAMLMRALDSNPGDIRLSIVLAVVYRDHPVLLPENRLLASGGRTRRVPFSQVDREQLADGIVDRMVQRNCQTAPAYLSRYQYRIRYHLVGATDDLHNALECAPRDPTVLAFAAEHSRAEAELHPHRSRERAKSLETARALYERLIAVAPSEEKAYLRLAQVLNAEGEPAKAIEVLHDGLRLVNEHSLDLRRMLAEILIQQGRLDALKDVEPWERVWDAETALRALEKEIARAGPGMTTEDRRDWRYRVDLLHAKRHLAKREYRCVLARLEPILATRAVSDPSDNSLPEALWLAGQAHGATGQWDLAVRDFEQAAVLRPQDPRYRWAVGDACERTGRHREAILHYQRMVATTPFERAWLALVRVRIKRQWSFAMKDLDWSARPRPESQFLAAGRVGAVYVQRLWWANLLVLESISDWKAMRQGVRGKLTGAIGGQTHVHQP